MFFLKTLILIFFFCCVAYCEIPDFQVGKEKHTFSSFLQYIDDKYQTKLSNPVFIIVETPNGKDKRYVKQKKILDSLDIELEEREIFLIFGCGKCISSFNYRLDNEVEKNIKKFQITIFNKDGLTLIKTDVVMDKNKIRKIIGAK